MKNLFNSPFEYWEKIGYVGYNNYTDLHLKLKKDIVFKNWQSDSKNALASNKNLFSHYNIHKYPQIKKINVLSKHGIKNTKKFKFFCIFNSLYYLIKQIHNYRIQYLKILLFLNSWKKQIYGNFLNLRNKNINANLSNKYIKLVNKVFNVYKKVIFFSFKKIIMFLKTKLYRYFKFFFKFQFVKNKKFKLYGFVKYILKNIYNIYKNPNLMYKINDALDLISANTLYDNKLLHDYSNIYSNIPDNKLFTSIPKKHNKNKELLRFYLFNVLNLNISKLKHFVKKNPHLDWVDIINIFNNTGNTLLKDLNLHTLKSLYVNGVLQYHQNNMNFLHNGDLLEYRFNDVDSLNKWINNRISLFYIFILLIKSSSHNNLLKLYIKSISLICK